jgi:DNA-directed RNA polymerase specialized sigma24 family protein
MTEEEFDQLHPSAFAIAYRLLRSVSAAEDQVQEARPTWASGCRSRS